MKKKQNHPILNEYIEWTKEIHPSGMRWLIIGEEETFPLPGGIEGRWVNLPTFLSAEEEDREPADGIYVAQALNRVNDWEPLCEILSAQYKECILIFSLDLATREGKALQRPSIYWLSRLSEGGFECLPRFAGGQFYCLASRSANESWRRLQERHRRTLCSICRDVQTNDAELLLAQESVQMEETQARIAFYFANLAFSPKQIQFACTTKTDSHPDLFLDQLKLHYIGSEKTGGNYRHRWEPLLIPTGARRLAIVTADPSAKLESMQIQSAPVSKEAFIKQLPFDHYQRYKFLAEILVRMEEKPASVLDVGGAYGYFPYFYSSCPAMVVDIVAEEAAYARGYDGQKLPFEDGTFDVVVSIDTVEHLPAGKRETFLRELTRVAEKAVVITGPFQEADVEEAETVLYDFITTHLQSHDRFLEEHRTFSLPKMDEMKTLLSQAGFSLCELPNGYLPRWLGMQLATYALGVTPELAGGRNRLNALYNTHAFESDNKVPSYRRAIIATKDTVSEEQRRRWQSLIQRKNEPDRSLWSIASLIVSLAQYKVLREKDQAIQHYTNRIKDFVDHTQNIEADRKQLQTHADNLNQRISELADLLSSQQKDAENYCALNNHLQQNNADLLTQKAELIQRNEELIRHADNLQAGTREMLNHNQNLEALRAEQENQIKEQGKHIANLEAIRAEKETQIEGQGKHIANLEAMLPSLRDHAQNLERAVESKDIHIKNLEQALSDSSNHATALGDQLAQLQDTLAEALSRPSKDYKELCSSLMEAQEPAIHLVGKMLHVLQEEKEQKQRHLETIHASRVYKILRKLRLVPRNID